MSATLDVTGTQSVPMSRLIKAEVRKMSDTRAGMWLLIVIGAITAIVTIAFFIWGHKEDRTWGTLAAFGGIPLGFLLPVLGILLVTQEWGQRTALVTFTQVPHRERIIVAKVVAALVFGLAGLLIAFALGAILAPIGGAPDPFSDFSVPIMLRIALGQIIGLAIGLSFGMLLLNSAFAIVLYFAIPIVVSIVGGVWTAARDKLLWFDLNTSSSQLYETVSPTGKEWAQIGTGTLIWIVIPGAIGIWRIMRSEVK
ncbi:MAG: ABC transporter permease subunit [Nocardioidaceae bacterium]